MAAKRTRAVNAANASRKRVKHDALNPPPTSTLSSTAVSVFVCGDGTAGELGLGNVRGGVEVTIPKRNKHLEHVAKFAAGGMHGIALDRDGRVLTWGGNDECALGRPTPAASDDDDDDDDGDDDTAPGLNPREATPAEVDALPADSAFSDVAAGDSCSFALARDGRVCGWGTFRGHDGSLGFTYDKGHGRTKMAAAAVRIPGLERVTQIAAGANFALALDEGGRVWGWGPNEQGETGCRLRGLRAHHPDETLRPQRATFPGSVKLASIHAGLYHAFAIDRAGRVWAWGLNNYGQTGIARGAGSSNPVIYPPQRVRSLDGKKIRSLAGGAHHSVALTDDGACLVWGRVDGFQTGLDVRSFDGLPPGTVMLDARGRPRILLEPRALPLPPCAAVAAGTDHSIAVARSGKVYTWGLNASAQCGQGSDTDIAEATLIQAKTVAEEKVITAAAGGQFSMFGVVVRP